MRSFSSKTPRAILAPPKAGQRDRHARDHEARPAGILGDRLRLMFEWYKGMVDENTGRLLYLYDPDNDVTIADGELIRDIAAIWDVEALSAFLGRDDLRSLIRRSLDHFEQLIVGRDGYAIVAPQGEESSSIAHSAFIALALIRSEFADKARRFAPLVDGILHQQREDGSYKIFFDSKPDSGEELYPAEAMLAILEAYRITRNARYLESVERSFTYYKREYYDPGLILPDLLVFFANWQSQAGRPLFEATARPELKDLVRIFLFELHDRIIESGFYDRVAHQPETQACVEVACGLEGLADAYAIAASSHDRRLRDYRRAILIALDFLVRAQRTTGVTDRERGGFGGSLMNREQRIDVTGHVASGFIKSLETGIDQPTT
jgi:hypothetical protein